MLTSARKQLQPHTHQQVLRLDVPVDDVQAVQVLDGAGQVEEHTAGVPLGVLVGGGDGVKEVPSLKRAESSLVRWSQIVGAGTPRENSLLTYSLLC